jgi:Tfp pilus assembly protein PilF
MRILKSSAAAVCLTALLTAPAAVAQDWRGMGRLAGSVTDESGAPLEGVVVKAHRLESSGGPEVKTNKKGEWVLAGINAGRWELDFQKPGYDTRQLSASVAERTTNPPVTAVLKKAPVDANVQIRADLDTAADLLKQQKYPEARAIYERILAQHPEAYQVEPYIARTYAAEHKLDPAIQHLRAALDKDPANVDVKILLASVLAEKGNAEESRGLIASIDDSKIGDPAVLLNVGIGLVNQKKPEDALTWFEKTVTRFPQYPDGYYYRGITQLQLGKTDAARADLEKFVALAPGAPEAATAKGILDKIKQ